jgi:hypothetical protein
VSAKAKKATPRRKPRGSSVNTTTNPALAKAYPGVEIRVGVVTATGRWYAHVGMAGVAGGVTRVFDGQMEAEMAAHGMARTALDTVVESRAQAVTDAVAALRVAQAAQAALKPKRGAR